MDYPAGFLKQWLCQSNLSWIFLYIEVIFMAVVKIKFIGGVFIKIGWAI